MRRRLLCVFLLAPAACGDASSAPLVSSDVAPETRAAETPRTWTVREGDSLRRIAKKVYGDERLWTAIRDANPAKVHRGEAVEVGAELTIPYEGM